MQHFGNHHSVANGFVRIRFITKSPLSFLVKQRSIKLLFVEWHFLRNWIKKEGDKKDPALLVVTRDKPSPHLVGVVFDIRVWSPQSDLNTGIVLVQRSLLCVSCQGLCRVKPVSTKQEILVWRENSIHVCKDFMELWCSCLHDGRGVINITIHQVIIRDYGQQLKRLSRYVHQVVPSNMKQVKTDY